MKYGHILTVTLCEDFDPNYPNFDFSIECINPKTCDGWQECSEKHEVNGVSAEDGPYDCEEGVPWDGCDEFEFHGILHAWHCGPGWTIPYDGCVVADYDDICSLAHDIALDHDCGRHEVEDEWDDTSLYLQHVRKLDSGE